MTGVHKKDAAESHWGELDGLRAIAILMVLVNHMFIPKATGGLSTVLNTVLSPTWLGVDLFFVLSGYLITGILLRARGTPHYFSRFYLRRVVRIFPAYYAVLLLVLLALFLLRMPGDAPPSSVATGLFFAYLQNWWPVWVGNSGFGANADPLWMIAAHFWSLAIEEQFYLVWPALLLLLPRQKVANRLGLIYLLVLAGKLTLWLAGVDSGLLFYGTLNRSDALILGAWVAAREHEQRPIAAVKCAWIGWLLALSAIAVHGYYVYLMPYSRYARVFIEAMPLSTVASIYFAWSLARLREGFGGKSLRHVLCSVPLAWLARLSYSLYLVHLPIQHLLMPSLSAALQAQGWSPNSALMLTGLAILPLCIAAALLLHHALERPLLRRRAALEARLLAEPAQPA